MVRMYSNGMSVVLVNETNAIVYVGSVEDAHNWAARANKPVEDLRHTNQSYGY